MSDKAALADLLAQKERLILENKLKYYDPYQFQVDFNNDTERFSALMSGNQQGKTTCGGALMAYHLTGLYPDWWQGWVFERPILAVAGGKNNEKTRDIIQAALVGEPSNKDDWGHGWLPKHTISRHVRKPGIPDALYHVFVKHYTNGKHDGLSRLTLLAYDMGKETWMAHKSDVNWLDEEPPQEILSQTSRSTIATEGITYLTFTPENGATDVVRRVIDEWSLHKSSWVDVSGDTFDLQVGDEIIKFTTQYTKNGKKGHLSESNIRGLIKGFLPHELKMRIKGEPVLGSGLVFPYSENDFKIDPIPIPDHWKRIAAIDFGGRGDQAHATALVWIAYDEATDVIYAYDCLRIKKKEIPEIAAQILTRPRWIPIVWPHDGNKITGQGKATKVLYEECGVNLTPFHFTNPPGKDEIEGKGGINVEPGILDISARINDGRLKVFSTLYDLFEEYRQYHTKDGKIIDMNDDLLSALRYACSSVRHATVKKTKPVYVPNFDNACGWMGG